MKKPEMVKIGTCTAGMIAGWLTDYAKYLKRDGVEESLIESVLHISEWLYDKGEEIDQKNKA